jgi:hypothetical protein
MKNKEREQLEKDLQFLREMLTHALKWDINKDGASRDMLFEMIQDWMSELKNKLK